MIKWNKAKPGDVEMLLSKYGGRGKSEDECIVSIPQTYKKDGYIEVYSSWGAATAQLLKRAGWGLLEWAEYGDYAVWMRFSKKVFRGITYSFKLDPDREDKQDFPEV